MNELVPIVLFFCLSAIILAPVYLKHRERLGLNETVRLAIDKGQALPPEMIGVLTADRGLPSPQRDLRQGVILICVAAAMGVVGWMQYLTQHLDHPERHIAQAIWGAAAFPGFVGLAFIVFGLMGLGKTTPRA